MNSKTKKLVMAALFAALACVATMVIKIPTPTKGYLNLGDCIVLLSGWLLPPFYSFLAAGIGSALADLFSGYIIYAPVTFIIKGLMAICAHFVFKALSNINGTLSRIISAVAAEIIMVLGYYLFEGILYGFIPSVAGIPMNIAQGVAGLILGVILVQVFKKFSID
ncbi:MAG: ECF transporter S component [Clostridia bacterium]